MTEIGQRVTFSRRGQGPKLTDRRPLEAVRTMYHKLQFLSGHKNGRPEKCENKLGKRIRVTSLHVVGAIGLSFAPVGETTLFSTIRVPFSRLRPTSTSWPPMPGSAPGSVFSGEQDQEPENIPLAPTGGALHLLKVTEKSKARAWR